MEEEGVLPDVHPRAPAAAGEAWAKGSGLDEGAGVGEARAERRATLRLCNLVAQSPGDAEGGLQAGGGEGTDGEGNRAVGADLLQSLQDPNRRDRASNRDSSPNVGHSQTARLLSADDLRRLPRGGRT